MLLGSGCVFLEPCLDYLVDCVVGFCARRAWFHFGERARASACRLDDHPTRDSVAAQVPANLLPCTGRAYASTFRVIRVDGHFSSAIRWFSNTVPRSTDAVQIATTLAVNCTFRDFDSDSFSRSGVSSSSVDRSGAASVADICSRISSTLAFCSEVAPGAANALAVDCRCRDAATGTVLCSIEIVSGPADHPTRDSVAAQVPANLLSCTGRACASTFRVIRVDGHFSSAIRWFSNTVPRSTDAVQIATTLAVNCTFRDFDSDSFSRSGVSSSSVDRSGAASVTDICSRISSTLAFCSEVAPGAANALAVDCRCRDAATGTVLCSIEIVSGPATALAVNGC
jgi:hypothetical protein